MKPLVVKQVLQLLRDLAGGSENVVAPVDENRLWQHMLCRARERFPEKLLIAAVAKDYAREAGVKEHECEFTALQLLKERGVPKGRELMRIGSEYKALSKG